MRSCSYLDLSGSRQGPFCVPCMGSFYMNSFFKLELVIIIETDKQERRYTLQELIDLNGIKAPFIFDDDSSHASSVCTNPRCAASIARARSNAPSRNGIDRPTSSMSQESSESHRSVSGRVVYPLLHGTNDPTLRRLEESLYQPHILRAYSTYKALDTTILRKHLEERQWKASMCKYCTVDDSTEDFVAHVLSKEHLDKLHATGRGITQTDANLINRFLNKVKDETPQKEEAMKSRSGTSLVLEPRAEKVFGVFKQTDKDVLRKEVEGAKLVWQSCSACASSFTAPLDFLEHILATNHQMKKSEGSEEASTSAATSIDTLEILMKGVRMAGILACKKPASAAPARSNPAPNGRPQPPAGTMLIYPFMQRLPKGDSLSVKNTSPNARTEALWNNFQSRSKATFIQQLEKRGWKMLDCNYCGSHFPTVAHCLEHLLTPKHFGKIYEAHDVPLADFRLAEHLVDSIVTATPADVAKVAPQPKAPFSVKPKPKKDALPLYKANETLEGRLTADEMEKALKGLFFLFSKCDTQLLSKQSEALLQFAPKNCPWCLVKIDNNGVNFIAHTFSGKHAEALKANGCCTKADIEFWREKLEKAVKKSPPVNNQNNTYKPKTQAGPPLSFSTPTPGSAPVHIPAVVTSLFSWNPLAPPLFKENIQSEPDLAEALIDDQILMNMDKLKQLTATTDLEAFNTKYADRLKKPWCDWCDQIMDGPKNTLLHLVSIQHGAKIPKRCRVTIKDINAWMNLLNETQLKGVRRSSPTPSTSKPAPKDTRAAVPQIPLAFRRQPTDCDDALSEKEVNDFQTSLKASWNTREMNQMFFTCTAMGKLIGETCPFCNIKYGTISVVLQHLLSRKHIEQIVASGSKVTKRDIKYWTDLIGKTTMKKK